MLEQKVQSTREDTPWGRADQRKCHRHFGMPSTVPRKNSQILHQSMCWRTAAMSLMILWCTTRRHPVTWQSPTGNDERRGIDAMPTTSIARNEPMTIVITKRNWIFQFSEIPHPTMPLLTMTGDVMWIIVSEKGIPLHWLETLFSVP